MNPVINVGRVEFDRSLIATSKNTQRCISYYEMGLTPYLRKLICRNMCSANSRIEHDFNLLPSEMNIKNVFFISRIDNFQSPKKITSTQKCFLENLFR